KQKKIANGMNAFLRKGGGPRRADSLDILQRERLPAGAFSPGCCFIVIRLHSHAINIAPSSWNPARLWRLHRGESFASPPPRPNPDICSLPSTNHHTIPRSYYGESVILPAVARPATG